MVIESFMEALPEYTIFQSNVKRMLPKIRLNFTDYFVILIILHEINLKHAPTMEKTVTT